MSYRDDLDAARARADALERQLTDARSEIAELKGETALTVVGDASPAVRQAALERASPREPTGAMRWLGAPTRLAVERVIDGVVPESAYTELVEEIRAIVGEPGTTQVLPRSLTWSSAAAPNSTGPFIHFYLSVRDGKTILRGEEKAGNLAGAIFGGIGGGVGGGGLMAPIAAAFLHPALLAVTLPLWLGGTYLACRKLFRARVGHRAVKLAALVDRLADIAARRLDEAAG